MRNKNQTSKFSLWKYFKIQTCPQGFYNNEPNKNNQCYLEVNFPERIMMTINYLLMKWNATVHLVWSGTSHFTHS